ncbi:MAG: hypothetical protein ACTSQE_03215 [Candidatus Heimdallarchaeaceae archaeon]
MLKNSNSSNHTKKIINDYQNHSEKSTIEDTTQAKEFLKVLSGEIGTIVEQLLGSIYNIDVAERYANSIIKIYEMLTKEGLSKQTVEKIVLEYSANLDKMISYLKREE